MKRCFENHRGQGEERCGVDGGKRKKWCKYPSQTMVWEGMEMDGGEGGGERSWWTVRVTGERGY